MTDAEKDEVKRVIKKAVDESTLSYVFGALPPHMMWEFAASPMLRGSRSLTLGACGIKNRGLSSLALSPYLANVDEVEIIVTDKFRPGKDWLALEKRFGENASLTSLWVP